MNSSEAGQHRCKCKVVAFVDWLWRLSEFSILILEIITYGFEPTSPDQVFGSGIIYGSILHKIMKAHKYGPHGFTMVSPLLGFLYIIATILQMAVACFLYKGCTGKSEPEHEIGACNIYFRISLMSFIILILHFCLPFVLVSLDHFLYTGARVIFMILGMLVVKLHARNLQRSLEHDDTMVNIPL